MRILLVSATIDFAFSGWLSKTIPDLAVQKVYTVPLHLATVAALTPDDIEVTLWDEAVQGEITENTDFGMEFDLVGVTAYSNHLSRAKKIGRVFRNKGIPVVIGGAGVTAEPETVRDDFDVLFLGEAEMTWPQFLADFKAGCYDKVYQATEFPDLSLSPAPRWDSIAHLLKSEYKTGGVQVNRGCPYDCEFCHVWIKFGRKIRSKPISQVLEEVATLERLGMKRIIFCTDNFVGDPRYAKALLRELIPLNNSFEYPLRYLTELTMIISRDEEMLQLLADANFAGLMIGLETPNKESLKETRKRQNIHGEMVDQCLKVSAYGMPIQGSLIVGFDHDTPEIFDQQFEFIQQARIIIPRLNILKAGRGTDLYSRMLREGRVMNIEKSFAGVTVSFPDDSFSSNIIPKKMTRVEMYAGYLSLLERVWDWKNFEERIIGFIDDIKRVPERKSDPRLSQAVASLKASIGKFPVVDSDVVEHVFSYAEQRVPSMVWDIGAMIVLQSFEAARLPVLRKALENQIRVEESLEATQAIVPELLDLPIVHSRNLTHIE
jgi:radical SAM superfamily enzyme YgiQ (UPF0313 family)